jgi:hypothetical protein
MALALQDVIAETRLPLHDSGPYHRLFRGVAACGFCRRRGGESFEVRDETLLEKTSTEKAAVHRAL